MGTRSTASLNPTLTNFAQDVSQDLAASIADFLMPRVVTPSANGQFKKYNEKQNFQVYATQRALGGRAIRIEFDATDPTYDCRPQALEVAIDDAERDAAGGNDAALERAKTRTLVTNAGISREFQVIQTVKAGVAAVGGLGNWSNVDIDPVAQIDSQIKQISIDTGRFPNRIAWGIGAWEAFRNHPKVIARQPGAALIGLNTMQASAMFLNPGMEQKIGVLSYDQAKKGAAANKANIVGDEVFIFYANQSPDIYDPSFAKTFTTGRGSVDSVRMYREEGAESDILAVRWSEDRQVISTLAVKRLTIS